jgi:hypothetical protein
MSEPESLISTARARNLAEGLARREGLTASEIVERALQAYAKRGAVGEPAEAFYRRLAAHRGEDIDLGALIQDHRLPHWGVDL